MIRLAFPESFLFRSDEAKTFEFSTAVSHDGQWLRHAWPSSVGIPNGPTVLYVWAAISRFTMNPVAANTIVVLLNCVALALCVPLFRRLFREADDVRLAVALMATSPVAIWFSRKIWDPCVLMPITVPAMLVALRAMQTDRSRAIFFLPPLLAIAAQAHQSAAFFAVAMAAAVATRFRRLAAGWAIAGVVVAIGISAPYGSVVIEELARGGVAPEATATWPDIDVVTNVLMNASGHNIVQVADTEAPEMLLWPFPPFGALVWLAGIAFFPFVLAGFAEILRPRGVGGLRDGGRELLLAVAVGVPVLLLIARVRGVRHYSLAFLPLLIALIPVGRRRLAAVTGGWRRALLPAPALLAINLLSWGVFQSYVMAHQGSESYGLPYDRIERACGEVAEVAREIGRGEVEDPLVVRVDIARDRGPLPLQYAYVLRHRFGVESRGPEAGEQPDVVLTIRWRKAGWHPDPPWAVSRGEPVASLPGGCYPARFAGGGGCPRRTAPS